MRASYAALPLLAIVSFTAQTGAQVRNDSFRVFTVHMPPDIARVDTIFGNDPLCGGQPPDLGITGRVVLVRDSLGDDQGCAPAVNAPEIAGQIALIRRGTCNFEAKMWTAQNAGAAAYLVFNHDSTPTDTDSTFYIMNCDTLFPDPEIAGGFLARYIRNAILPSIQSGAVVTATLAPFFIDTPPPIESGPEPAGTYLRVAPNPTTGTLRVVLRLNVPQSVEVEIHDVLGRRVLTVGETSSPGESLFISDVSQLPPGAYVARASGNQVDLARRFSVLR